MTFQVLRIVLLNCHQRSRAKMSMSGKFEIPSGKCQGILFPSERGNPVNKVADYYDIIKKPMDLSTIFHLSFQLRQ